MHALHNGAGKLHVTSFPFLEQWLSELFLTSDTTQHDKTWQNTTQQLKTEHFATLSFFFSFLNWEVRMSKKYFGG